MIYGQGPFSGDTTKQNVVCCLTTTHGFQPYIGKEEFEQCDFFGDDGSRATLTRYDFNFSFFHPLIWSGTPLVLKLPIA